MHAVSASFASTSRASLVTLTIQIFHSRVQSVACCMWNWKPVCLPACRPFMRSLLLFPKPLVSLVNGPGIGIGLSLLPHCDLVLAARGAWFSAPFTHLGIVPEAGSSFLFPLLVGRSTVLVTVHFSDRSSARAVHCSARACFWKVGTHVFLVT